MIPLHRAVWATWLLASMFGSGSLAAERDPYGDSLPSGAVARLGTTRLRDSSVLQAIAYSPDGNTLVAASASIRIWDAADGRLVRELVKDSTPYRSLAVAPDGKTVAFPESSRVNLLHTTTGKLVHSFAGHEQYSECTAYSPDGKVLASGGRDGTIRFWDMVTGKELRTLDNPGETTYLAYTPDGKSLISTSWSGRGNVECQSWELETGKVVRRWEDIGKPGVLSPDGKILATGTADFQLCLWDMDTGKELKRFELPRENSYSIPAEAARCAAFSPDGTLVAAGDMTDRVHVWEVSTGKELHCSPPLGNPVTCLAFSPDGKTLAVGAWQQILLWEATSGKDQHPFGAHADEVGNVVAFSPDGKTIATQSGNSLILWDPLTGRERQKWADKTLVAFSPNGDMLLREEGSIVQWKPATGKVIRHFEVYGREFAEPEALARITVVFSRDRKAMVSGSLDRTIRMWDFATGELLWQARREDKDRQFPADIGGHWPLGFTHDGKAVVTLSDDAVVRFWDAATGKELRWFRIDAREAALSPDGRFLVAVGKDVAAPDGKSQSSSAAPPRLWDLTEEDPQPTELYARPARCPAFSPDGGVVAVGDGPNIVLLEYTSGKELRRLKGHQDDVLQIAFAPNGRLLVSDSYDLTALVWELR